MRKKFSHSSKKQKNELELIEFSDKKIDELKVLEAYQDTVAFKFKAYSIKPVEFFI